MEKATVILNVMIEPHDFGNIQKAIKSELKAKEKKFIREIGAIFMSYINHKIVSKSIRLLYNRPQICIKVQVICNVLTPRVGIIVPAKVTYVDSFKAICLAYKAVKIEIPESNAKKHTNVNVEITGIGRSAFKGIILNEI